MKKVLSLVLVIAMVLSSMSFAFAGTFEDVTGDYEDAVEALVALGVINGYEDGTFRPERTITRAELAKVLVEALGYGNLVAGASSSYSDTQGHWAAGYVTIASGTGLVIGYPNGTFQPDKAVTYDEALTMVVRALGYTDAALKGTWPTNFKVKAIDLDLTDDVVMASANADRGGVAQIIFNALEANLVTVDSDNNVVVETKVVATKTVNKILLDKIATYEPDYDVTTLTLDENSKKYGGNVIDLAPYMYQSLEVYLNDDGDVVFIKDTNSLVVSGTIDTSVASASTLNIKDAAGTVHKVPMTTTSLFFNGAQEESYAMADLKTITGATLENVTVVAVDDADYPNDKIEVGEITGVVATQPTQADLIESAYKEGRKYIDEFDLPVVDGEVDLDNITVTGEVSSLEDIKVDDVVVAYESMDKTVIKLVVSRDTVEGEVTRLASDGVYVDGTKYKVNKAPGSIALSDIKLGNEGVFFLDHTGKIVAFDGETAAPSDYAIVIAPANGTVKDEGRFDAQYEIDKMPALKLATQENEVVIYDIFVEIDEDDASVSDVATYDDENADLEGKDLVVTASAIDADVYETLKIVPTLTKGTLIQYSLNEDGQIEAITIVDTDPVNVDPDHASFKLADKAVIFDSRAGEDYAVVSGDDLDSDGVTGYGVYNSNGELEVIVTSNIDTTPTDTTIAYLKSTGDIATAYDADKDEVQVVTVYMNGEKQDVYTDGSSDAKFAAVGAYELEFDGDVVVKATPVTPDDATVVSVSASSDMVKLEIEGVTAWYTLADDVTMIKVKTGYTSYEFIDLYDLDPEMTVKAIVNSDGEVEFLGFPVEAAK